MKKKALYLLKENIFCYLDYGQSKYQFEYFRIAIALFSLFNFGAFLYDYEVFVSPNGIINWEVTKASSFWFDPHPARLANWLNMSHETFNIVAICLYVGSLVLLALGVFTRVSSLLAFFFFLVFSLSLYPFLYGVDLYQSVFLLFLTIFPSGYALSLTSKKSDDKILNQQKIAVRGIQIYLALTYFSAGFGKFNMDSWFNGEFLYLSLSDPTYQLLSFTYNVHYGFYVFSGILVVFIEMFYCMLVLIPYVRTVLIITIVGMHLFIALFMGLIPFGVLLMMVNLVVWYPVILTDLKKLLKIYKRYELAI